MRRRGVASRAALPAVALALLVQAGCRPAPEEAPSVVEAPPETPPPPVAVELYFPGEDGRLHSERRELEPAADAETWTARVVEALLAGPRGEGLWPPLPAGVTVGATYRLADGTLVVDLESPDAGPPPPVGSLGEMLMVYSLVDTVLLNPPAAGAGAAEAGGLILLWNGRQSSTFAGHVDMARPLRPHLELIAGGPKAAALGSSSP